MALGTQATRNVASTFAGLDGAAAVTSMVPAVEPGAALTNVGAFNGLAVTWAPVSEQMEFSTSSVWYSSDQHV